MRHRRTQAHTILRDLGDGLILRRATPDDAEALATFNAQIFRTAGSEQPNMGIAAWTQDLLSGDHPPAAQTILPSSRRPAPGRSSRPWS